jgi:hypothetical protein
VFDETIFPFSQLHPNAGSQLRAEILLLPLTLRNFHEDALVDDHRDNGANPGAAEFDGVQVDEIIEETTGQETSSSTSPQQMNNEANLAMEPVATEDQGESTWSSAPVQHTKSVESIPDPVSRQTIPVAKSRAYPSSPNTCPVQVRCDTPARRIASGSDTEGGSDGQHVSTKATRHIDLSNAGLADLAETRPRTRL